MHFGVPMAGAVLNTINTRLDAHATAVLLKHSEAKVLFLDPQFIPVVHDAVQILSEDCTFTKPFLVLIEDKQGKDSIPNEVFTYKPFWEAEYEDLLKSGDPSFSVQWPEEDQPISLNYTSGTTASPKGVIYTHRGAHLNCLASITMGSMKLAPVMLWTLPMFHCNGWCFTWVIAAQGGTNICLRNLSAKATFDAIAEHKVTHLCGAPVVLNIIINSQPHERKPLPHKVEVFTGGAPPPPSILSQMEQLGFIVHHSYGLTETYGPALICDWRTEWDALPLMERALLKSRQGVVHLGLCDADVKDPSTMLSVPRDGQTLGEVMLRGNTVMKGYFKDQEATAKAFEGGWFHTGDLGVIHPDAYIQLKDRSKDIIISGGENISSIEVESVLFRHPQILEAAVVARPDDYWGETPCAFVSLKDSATNQALVSSESVIAFCRKHLSGYMVPRSVVFGELPKTATGKVQKFVLRERAKSMGSLPLKISSKL
ncbi:hypothetical protein O6H91_04G112000 [Diphasiastrum complanatum]|nr:hypothetical protein O6H91_Y151300 [Diphasiastrum complanatum]KAJ7560060.1 hypothetical protein O6H91_04G112000 [Diphasiastrum complanatum]